MPDGKSEKLAANTRLPAASVDWVMVRSVVSPSPWPDGSHPALENNWIVNDVFGVLFSVPVTVVMLSMVDTLSITG
jgi:hypothetical protein